MACLGRYIAFQSISSSTIYLSKVIVFGELYAPCSGSGSSFQIQIAASDLAAWSLPQEYTIDLNNLSMDIIPPSYERDCQSSQAIVLSLDVDLTISWIQVTAANLIQVSATVQDIIDLGVSDLLVTITASDG